MYPSYMYLYQVLLTFQVEAELASRNMCLCSLYCGTAKVKFHKVQVAYKVIYVDRRLIDSSIDEIVMSIAIP